MYDGCLLELLQICDSLFPIGAFALSNGMETYVQRKYITQPQHLKAYLSDFLAVAPYQELGTMLLAAKHADDMSYIINLDEWCAALRAPMEVRQGSSKLCIRLLKAAEQIAPLPVLAAYRQHIADGHCVGQHPIAVGLFAAGHGADLEQAALLYGYSLLSALTTNAVKSVPLRQLDGQRVLRESFDQLKEAVQQAQQVTLSDLGIGGAAFDLFAMEHETLYSRLYMS